MKRVTVVQYDSVTVVPCDRITVPPSDRLTVTPSHRIAGFTLVEAVISLVIVSVMLTAALSVVSSSRLSQYHTTQDSQGQFLAQSLLTEIMNQAYLDPNGNSGWGPEVGESTPTRAGRFCHRRYHRLVAQRRRRLGQSGRSQPGRRQ